MNERVYEILTIAPNFYQLGTPSYPAYLTMGGSGMIIEGGTGATFPILVNQIKELGIAPERIEYIALTHTHPDHVGARSHGGVVEGEPRRYLQRVMKATEAYHRELMERVAKGEDPDNVVLEKAKWVYTFTSLQPFKLIHIMTGVTLKRSQSVADEDGLFVIPD